LPVYIGELKVLIVRVHLTEQFSVWWPGLLCSTGVRILVLG